MTEEKKHYEEKKYAILSKNSIKSFAEAAGYSNLPDDIAGLLAEDVVYRVREATQHGHHYMKHARRKRLTTQDFHKSLASRDVQPLFGHSGTEAVSFRETREGELHFVDDRDINLASLATSTFVPNQTGRVTVKAHWLAVEGAQKPGLTTPGIGGLGDGTIKPVSGDLLMYYEHITKAILGGDGQLMKHALSDLRSNANISPLLPFFVSFVSTGVKKLNHDVSQLTKLLHMVKSLMCNQSLFLEPKPYLDLLVEGVMYCVVEPLAASINPRNDHWVLRDYAARLLAQLTRISRQREPSQCHCYQSLLDPTIVHYTTGVVMGATTMRGVLTVSRVNRVMWFSPRFGPGPPTFSRQPLSRTGGHI